MRMPGFTAEDSIYRSMVTYATGRTLFPVTGENVVTPQQSVNWREETLRISPSVLCRFQYWLCRTFIPSCTGRCLSNSLVECAFASNPQACEAAVWQRCSGTCTVACDQQYANCLAS